MSWFFLVLAGLFEIGWALGLKYTQGFSKPIPTVFTIGSMVLSIWLLSLAVRHLSISTAYAVWTGIGTIGTVVIGMAFLGEPRHAARIICVVLIVLGVAGLKVFGGKSA